MTEDWKSIIGFEGLYEVSNFGNVRSLPRHVRHVSKAGKEGTKFLPGRILKKMPLPNGYLRVALCREGNYTEKMIHHLVLENFVGLRSEGMEARHFPDRSKTNNQLSNLSWGTHEQNELDKIMHGTACCRGADGRYIGI